MPAMENTKENLPVSKLRLPTKVQSPAKLTEMSTSDLNSRPERPHTRNTLKRKGMADDAEDLARPAAQASNARIKTGHTQPRSLSNLSSNSTFSRSASAASSRNLSQGSTARPQSAQSNHKYGMNGASGLKRFGASHQRADTSLGTHLEEVDERIDHSQMVWDHDARLKEVHLRQEEFMQKFADIQSERVSLQEDNSKASNQISELEAARTKLTAQNEGLQSELETVRLTAKSTSEQLEDTRRRHRIEIDDLQRQHRNQMTDAQHAAESHARKMLREQNDRYDDLRRKHERDLEQMVTVHAKEINELQQKGTSCQEESNKELVRQKGAFAEMEFELEKVRSNLGREISTTSELRSKISGMASATGDLETTVQRLESHIKFLESDNKSQSQAFADIEARMQNAIRIAAEANEKLIKEETLRRKLHNQVQELKGNIRVFCRARPALESDSANNHAKISYPDDESDCKDIEILGPEEKSSLGNITTKKNPFSFDRVFGPSAQNEDIFDEISQLVQSALDGYNVCIFAYGQTGSGKTFTMSSDDGMIPRAVHQIYDTTKALEEKGWKYSMEGSFIEVYNENLNDLLGKAEEYDKKKHEIKHDLQKGKTTITGIATVALDSPDKVNGILARATSNRSVAATQANERSSRSHSVFILKLLGENSITGEHCEGTLNLVDLAGSERLSHSGATGERLKETQNINKSLSCLGDVISALGQGKEGAHVPYRNSKLTYLLQNSLGGNSKTLMFVMISPLQAHLSETLTSLKFATKVHNTHIGTAKKMSRT